jgi:hypothetical protein
MRKRRRPPTRKNNNNNNIEVESRLEGPIRPINYSGTQINVWGMPTPNMQELFGGGANKQRQQPHLGPHTADMLNKVNTPRAIEPPKDECSQFFSIF